MPKKILVIAVDGLRASSLGAYGNGSYNTPTFDRFAAESFLADWAFAPSTDLLTTYQSLWENKPTLRSTLITDEPVLAKSDLAAAFETSLYLEPADTLAPAFSVEETSFANLFATAASHLSEEAQSSEALSSETASSLTWLHLSSLTSCWDAPLSLRESFIEKDDPEAYAEVTVPNLCLETPEQQDPDFLLPFVNAYAAQIEALDHALAVFFETLTHLGLLEETLVLITGVRGYSLGETKVLGLPPNALNSAMLHVPLLVRYPDASAAMTRSQTLIQLSDLGPTFEKWLQPDSKESEKRTSNFSPLVLPETRTLIRAANFSQQIESLYTPEWFLIREKSAPAEFSETVSKNEPVDFVYQLFVKPDDRTDSNEISSRCVEVVEELAKAFDSQTP